MRPTKRWEAAPPVRYSSPVARFYALGFVMLFAASSAAHPLAPALLELREQAGGRVDILWKEPLVRVPGPPAVPALPSRCVAAANRESSLDGTGLTTRFVAECGPGSLVGERVGVRDVTASGAVVRVVLADGRVVQGLVVPDDPWFTIPPVASVAAVFTAYARLGIAHILSGPDHLLFVFGLVLLAGSLRRLLATVTAFTLGHSITLAAAVLGLIKVPQAPIEVAIAASVFVLAAELARDPERPDAIRRRPWMMAALFGLLHGLGFAAALTDAGLPRGEVPLALFAFNVGIEAGQLAFVGVVLAGRAAIGPIVRRLPGWGLRVPVYAMGSLAAFWWLERTLALFR